MTQLELERRDAMMRGREAAMFARYAPSVKTSRRFQKSGGQVEVKTSPPPREIVLGAKRRLASKEPALAPFRRRRWGFNLPQGH